MEEPTSPGSPSREGSMKKSSNPLSKLLFRRKGSNSSLSPSSRGGEDNGDEASGAEVVDGGGLNKDPSLVEEVKEVVENLEHSVHDLFHHHKTQNSAQLSIDAATSVDSRDSSFSSESNKGHKRHRFLNKVKHGLDKAKEEYGKAKDELKAIVGKDKSQHGYDQPHEKYSDSDSDSSKEEKSPSVDDEVIPPSLAQYLQEEEALEVPEIAQSIQEEVVEVPNIIAQSVQEEVAKAPKIAQSVQEEVAKAPKIAQSVQEEVAKAPKIAQNIQEEVVKAPNIAQRIQEEVVAVISTIDEAKKSKTSAEPSKDVKVEKKEDNCITSLAQGLQNLCSWGSKKED